MATDSQEVRVPVTGVRTSAALAMVLAAVAVVLAVVAVVLPLVGGYDYLRELLTTPEVAVAVSFSATGALLARNDQARRIGWLLLGIGTTSAVYAVSVSYTAFVLQGDPDAALPPGADLAHLTAWISGWAWLPAWIAVSTVLPQVVPYGRPLSPVWRIPLAASGLLIVLGVLTFALAPGETGIFPTIDNPMAVPAISGLLDFLESTLDVVVVALILIALASVVVRVVRADAAERRQVGWVGYAVVLTVLFATFGPDLWSNVAVLLVPAGIAVAALRYRLYDLDLLVNRTLVAGVLLAGAALAYVAVVAWVGSLVGTSGGAVPFIAAFALALAFNPARLAVQRWVDRLFFGRRGDPYSLLRDLDATLRQAASPRAALGDAVDLLQRGLRLSGVSVVVPMPSGGVVQEQAGTPRGDVTTLPLTLHEEQVGELRVGGRTAGPLSGTDIRVLQALAGPLASAAYALRLSGDLEESRRRLLETREDERRRLRRDLHDGLGPQLAGVVMGLDVIRSTLAQGNADGAVDLATTVTDQAKTAVEDVRRLVAGLRPPVLDDLGLLGALQASGPASVNGSGPAVRFSTSGSLGELPAAVEVAAYRIATEAMTNALRHAAARTIDVRLEVTAEEMTVQVSDDGAGIRPAAPRGVGLVSMRERAAELGGWCTITPSSRGTTVVASLPLGAA